MGVQETEKFKRSVAFYVKGIDPQGLEIYEYNTFKNLIRNRIRGYVRTAKNKVDQKAEILNLLKELEEVKK